MPAKSFKIKLMFIKRINDDGFLRKQVQLFVAICILVWLAACSSQSENTSEPASADSQVTLIQLTDPLDEPEYYCIDVPGFGASLNLDGALTAHTCKPNADDELFIINHPAVGQLYMPAYDRCLEADGGRVGAELHLGACSDSPLQRFIYGEDSTIQLQHRESEALCVSAADKAGEPTGGPSHLRRELLLQACSSVETALSRWAMPGSEIP